MDYFFPKRSSIVLPKGNRSKISTNLYDPVPIQMMTSMLYLSLKYPDHCVVIPFERINRRVSQPYHQKVASLIWYESSKILRAPKNFWQTFKKCDKTTKRFIIFPLTISWDNGEGLHANFMIYDSKLKTLERFEPYGELPSPKLDKVIKETFIKKYGQSFIKKYYAPPAFCPDESFQELQEREKKISSSDNLPGFCQAWSTWYADLRLSNPDTPPKDLVNAALRKIQRNRKTYTDFIRSYADFQNEWNDIVLDNPRKQYSKLFTEYIKQASSF
jgi:hypothetical protein